MRSPDILESIIAITLRWIGLVVTSSHLITHARFFVVIMPLASEETTGRAAVSMTPPGSLHPAGGDRVRFAPMRGDFSQVPSSGVMGTPSPAGSHKRPPSPTRLEE